MTFAKILANGLWSKLERRSPKYRWSCYMCQLVFDDLQERDEHVRTVHYGEVE